MKYRKECKRLLDRIARISCYKILAIIVLLNILIIIWRLFTQENALKRAYTNNIQNKNSPRKHLSHIRNPTIIYWTANMDKTLNTLCESKCDLHYGNVMLPPNTEGVYLFRGADFKMYDLPLPRNPKKVIWAIVHDESPTQILELSHEKGLNLFNYSSTFSRYSHIPFPLQFIVSLEYVTSTKYFVETKIKNCLLNQFAPILYLQSNCETVTERDNYIKAFKKLQRIDSYGLCLRNRELPSGLQNTDQNYVPNLQEDNFLKFVANYKFVVAIENVICDDYITEKLWRAIHVGVVPIYFGSPSIRDWLPNEKSAILLSDFPTPTLLSQHIDKLMQDDKLYEEYLEHKTKGQISNRQLIKELKVRPYQTSAEKTYLKFVCFLCKILHEKEKTVNVVTGRHCNCPKPVSVLSQKVERSNHWVESWESVKDYTDNLYHIIMNQ